MKKTNILLAASIAALLSGCGGGGDSSTTAAPAVSTTTSSSMTLPDNVSLARETSSASLASVSYAAFDDAGTDYSNQTQVTWVDDGSDYAALTIINGVLKIMTFTKAAELANKGTYKILFDDPFDDATTKQKAYVKVTRANTESTTPLYVHFYMSENWSGALSRLVTVKVDQGKSATAPLGGFELNMILLKDGDYSSDSLASWETTARGESDPFFETMTLKVSPDATTAGQTNIQLNLINDGSVIGNYNNTNYNKSHLGANIITTGALDSGYGWLIREWGIGTNDYSYDDELFPSFDDKYIADRVGESTEGDTNHGLLSYRSQFTSVNYTYKIFNTDGTKLDLGNTIAAFGFKDSSENFGWIGTNYAGTNNPATSSDYSGVYYHDSNLSVGDVVTKFGTEDTYTVTAVNTTTKLVDLKNTSNAIVAVGSWSSATIGGKTFYKNGDTLYPGWTSGTPNTISGSDITISGTDYKVKPTLVKKSRTLVDETEGDTETYADLSDFVTAASDKAKVKALTDQISDLSSITRSSGLGTFNTSILNSTYEWYRDTVKGKESDIVLRVVDGQVISTE
jgi:hypothetical protein